ncbi:hypothetical protein SDC9_199050 [bioreactor metagenome]|uniref:Uncharacterized protein n=1 Tax=bioreactor metagenome TaxID=1076179 RepID=A0A645IJD9_9ZZZZ
MAMSRNPQQKIWIGVQRGNQLAPFYRRVGGHAKGVNRDVRRDDHQLAFRLPLVQFSHQPVITLLIQISMLMNIEIFVPLGIVEHDHLDWQIRFRLETV